MLYKYIFYTSTPAAYKIYINVYAIEDRVKLVLMVAIYANRRVVGRFAYLITAKYKYLYII